MNAILQLFNRILKNNKHNSNTPTNTVLNESTTSECTPVVSEDNIRILALADLHYWEPEELRKISDCKFDICVLLGDIPKNAIQNIVEFIGSKPIFAVSGNHDTWNMFEGFPITDLHLKTDICRDFLFSGFGGSVKYKNGPYAMHTQEEGMELIKNLAPADILISHDSKYGLYGKTGPHEGLKGITEYIDQNKVRLNLCGHHHQACIKKENGCTTVCVYRCAVVTYPTITVKQVF